MGSTPTFGSCSEFASFLLDNTHFLSRFAVLQNFVKYGQHWALVFDQPLLERLKINPESPVELSISKDNSVTITPALAASHEAAVRAAREKNHAEHAAAFQKLAE